MVEDEGLFLYSHHTTDPCTDRLCNAFDLVRIHLFGHLDDGMEQDGVDATSQPSYKAMVKFLKDDEATTEELAAARYDIVAIFEDADLGEDGPAILAGRRRRPDLSETGPARCGGSEGNLPDL